MVRDSLTKYGNGGPRVAYTDDVASDKPLLERTFPSLTQNISATPSSSLYAQLESYSPPIGTSIVTIDSADVLTPVCNFIINAVKEEKQIYIGFDAEWNVEVEQRGGYQHREASSTVAVVQVAYEKKIYVIQVRSSGFDFDFSRIAIDEIFK